MKLKKLLVELECYGYSCDKCPYYRKMNKNSICECDFDDEYNIDDAVENAREIIKLIDECDETSATKCFECINKIKNEFKTEEGVD